MGEGVTPSPQGWRGQLSRPGSVSREVRAISSARGVAAERGDIGTGLKEQAGGEGKEDPPGGSSLQAPLWRWGPGLRAARCPGK